MASVFSSPEDVINDSLVRIGWKRRVGSIYEGSAAAKIALDIYGQTRDALLRESDWGFAERDLPLTLLKTAPPGGYTPPLQWSSQYPILPWIYEYSYPADCLKLRALRPVPAILPEFDPSPHLFRIANDSALNPGAKVILANLSSAVAVYTAQVTDPTTWEPLFTEALSAALARRLSAALASAEVAKEEATDESAESQAAAATLG